MDEAWITAMITIVTAITGAVTTILTVIRKKERELEQIETENSINGQLLQWMCEAEGNYKQGHEKLDYVMQRVEHYCKTHDRNFDYGFYREKVNFTLRNLKSYKFANESIVL
ncbi:MAG: hypothetical protein LBU60_06840 [Clostridiales bacterium]|jgi:hypothetical protein|nr:hypothetical protein [Clostridiales bacterium]